MSRIINSTAVEPLVDWCATWLEGLAAGVSMQTHGSGCADLSSKYKRCQALLSSPPSDLGFGQSTVDTLDIASRVVQHVAQTTVTACEQQAFAVFKSAVGVDDLDWPACFADGVVPWRDTNADARAAIDAWASKSTVEASILTELLVHIDDHPDDATKCECLVAITDFKIMWSRAAKKVWQVLGVPCETEIYPTALCQSMKDLSTAMVKVQSFIDSRSSTQEGQSPLATAAQKQSVLDLGDIVSQVATDADSCSTRYEALLDSIAKHGEGIVQSLMDAAQAEFQADFRDWAWDSPDEAKIEDVLKKEPRDLPGLCKKVVTAAGGIRATGLAGNTSLGALGQRLSTVVKRAEDLDDDARLFIATHGGLKLIVGARKWTEAKLEPRKSHYFDVIAGKGMAPEEGAPDPTRRLSCSFYNRVKDVVAQVKEPEVNAGTPKAKGQSATGQSPGGRSSTGQSPGARTGQSPGARSSTGRSPATRSKATSPAGQSSKGKGTGKAARR